MATSYIYNIAPFDATKDYMVEFSYSGGNQAYSNRIVVTDNESSLIVYQHDEQTLQHKHNIPANTLTNGKKYAVTITIYDVENKMCSTTQPLFFLCLSVPSFRFSNISENQTIRNSNCTVNLTYSQSEGEELQSYSFLLYGKNKNLLVSSDTIFDTNNMSYTFDGFDDDSQYYVRATGKTINGMNIDTGYILFNVDYILPVNWSLLDLTNQPDKGAIQIRSNIITINGYSTNVIPHFIDNEYLDLTRGDKVIFDENFNMGSNWTIIGSMYGCEDRAYVLIVSDGINNIKIQYRIDSFEGIGKVAYMQLTNENAIDTYMIYSNYINVPNNKDVVSFCVRREGSLYDIEFKNIGGGV